MKTPSLLFFPPFHLDVGDEQLWHGARAIKLRPKTFAVLRYLAGHPGRLVTKEEVLNAVWPQTAVSEWVLKSCIRELREALGDEALTPHYIETVHRRGYRFLPAVTTTPPVSGAMFNVSCSDIMSEQPETRNEQPETLLIGREPELAQLHWLLEKALNGERQMVFVTGEPGIGKTALIDTFLLDAQREEERQKVKGKRRSWGLEDRDWLLPASLQSPASGFPRELRSRAMHRTPRRRGSLLAHP